MFNAPWPALALAASIVASYALQSLLITPDLVDRFSVSGPALAAGHVEVLITWLWLHGGWPHALGNAAFCLAFATPVARRMGETAGGVVAFIIFYLLCGALAGLASALSHWSQPIGAIGASGAVAGFMGAASRLMVRGPRLAAFTSAPVMAMAACWLVINLVFGLLPPDLTPGAGGLAIDWHAHLAGYAAGLLLIGPALRLLGRI